MSTTLPLSPPPRHRRAAPFGKRREPGRLPAAILAILVHGGFFVVLVLGVSWTVKSGAPVEAELWSQLPPLRNVPEPTPDPPAPPPEPEVKRAEVKPEPVVPSRAEIELKAKKEKAEKEKKKKEEDLAEARRRAALEEKQRKDEAIRRRAEETRMAAEQEAREASQRNTRNAAIAAYTQQISRLISSRANIPDTVTGKPTLQIRLRLLVNGAVLDAKIMKPSGNQAFDDAVERAINGIQIWPLPDPPEILGGRRELILNFSRE